MGPELARCVHRSFRAEDPNKRKNHPAEQRAALVPKQHFSKARSLDHQLHGTPQGKVGPILGRLHDLVLSPDDPKGITLDPDKVAHEHRSFFFPDNGHGAANAAGFGWRNGGKSSCMSLFAPP